MDSLLEGMVVIKIRRDKDISMIEKIITTSKMTEITRSTNQLGINKEPKRYCISMFSQNLISNEKLKLNCITLIKQIKNNLRKEKANKRINRRCLIKYI